MQSIRTWNLSSSGVTSLALVLEFLAEKAEELVGREFSPLSCCLPSSRTRSLPKLQKEEAEERVVGLELKLLSVPLRPASDIVEGVGGRSKSLTLKVECSAEYWESLANLSEGVRLAST